MKKKKPVIKTGNLSDKLLDGFAILNLSSKKLKNLIIKNLAY